MSDINSVNMSRTQGDNLHKGDEIGYFAYGGSGIVMFFEPGVLKVSLPAGAKKPGGVSMKMGQKIGNLNPISR
jgi:phosphatidylserine decarboxylase